MRRWLFSLILFAALMPLTPAQAQDVYRFGYVTALTGPLAIYGTIQRQALEMALEEINLRGGVDGKRLEAIVVDDQANPALAVSAVRRFISVDRVPLILGSYTATALAAIPVAEEGKTVFMTPLVTHPGVIHKSPWAFSVSIDLPRTSAFVTDFAYKRGARRMGLIIFNNESTRRMGEVVARTFESLGGKVVAKEIMPPGTDFRSTLLKVKAANPDTVVIASFVSFEALLLKQMAEMGWKIPVYSANPVEEGIFFKTVGDSAEGLLYGSIDVDTKRYEDFERRFIARYKEDPGTFGAQAYEAGYVIAEAIKRGGYSPEGIRKALAELKDFKGILGTWSFDEGGFAKLPLTMKVVKGRRFEKYQP